MCGIIGYIGPQDAVPLLITGLRRLEYRGYDSAGIAVVSHGRVHVRRSAGKLSRLEELINGDPIRGNYGIGHTRWATHPRPTAENAHPHRDCSGRIVLVHNGIIENYADLKRRLLADGHRFETETDTEVVAHLAAMSINRATLRRASPSSDGDAPRPGLPSMVAAPRHAAESTSCRARRPALACRH